MIVLGIVLGAALLLGSKDAKAAALQVTGGRKRSANGLRGLGLIVVLVVVAAALAGGGH